ncbi:transcriptional regulator, TetR family [Leptospira inadai serovar Lyme str. 10]|uniref:Transcriptional regulator, TetR family n=2 Tax=Leptospira inadai serovar Lyme TaxID=293084 RepID=V6HYH3_9LEPT|nr:TetR/AcrR family transcriptional regulator [Leptospira inadai]EQA38064.1 transcriptional regulator, TetR family [Leptospira inadai serovar Lyme str. 10]PNV74732.1 TetR/AcrR family transcriptional regulator [Leptospira inadai serovar Lyme]
MKRVEQSNKVRAKILEVSRKLFVSEGYEKATIRRIIDEAGITTGSLYHFFKNKEEILFAIASEVFSEASETAERLAGEFDPPVVFALEIGLQLYIIHKKKSIAETYLAAYRTHGVLEMIGQRGAARNAFLFGKYNPDFDHEEYLIRTHAFRGMFQALLEEALYVGAVDRNRMVNTALRLGLSTFGVPKETIDTAVIKTFEILTDKAAEIEILANELINLFVNGKAQSDSE